MTSLISRERALLAVNQTTFTADELLTIDNHIEAVSSAAQRYTRTNFALDFLDELQFGGSDLLVLDSYPVIEVHSLATTPTAVLTITNTDSTNQRATVQVTPIGLKLVRVASGTASIDESVAFADNTTLTALASAVTALGNGWAGSLPRPTYANWPTHDLRPIQGARNARGVLAPIYHHVEEITDFQVDPRRGWLTLDGWAIWPGREYRIRYTAGYDPVPEDVQEAVAQWAASLFWQSKDNPASYPSTPPDSAAFLLEQYKRIRL